MTPPSAVAIWQETKGLTSQEKWVQEIAWCSVQPHMPPVGSNSTWKLLLIHKPLSQGFVHLIIRAEWPDVYKESLYIHISYKKSREHFQRWSLSLLDILISDLYPPLLFSLCLTGYIYATIANTLITLTSLFGIVVLLCTSCTSVFQLCIQFCISLAVGSLTGDALLHLIPMVSDLTSCFFFHTSKLKVCLSLRMLWLYGILHNH